MQNNVVNNVLKRAKTLKQKGYSLVEVVIAIGIGSVVSLGVASVFVFSVEQFTVLVDQNAAEENLVWSAYQLRSILGQAVDIRVTTSPIPAGYSVDTTSNPGLIVHEYDSDMAAFQNNFTNIATFIRETSTSADQSILDPAGVYAYAVPNNQTGVNSQPMGNVLFLPIRSGAGVVAPSLNGIWFDRFSRIRIEEVECTDGQRGVACNNLPAKSVTFTLTVRYFKSTQRNAWSFDFTPPANTAPYRDVDMSVKVGLRNNVLIPSAQNPTGAGVDERLFGGLYFYKLIMPQTK